MSLLTLGILGIVAAVILICAFFIDDEDWRIGFFVVSIVGLLVVGGGGFGLHAVNNYEKMVVEETVPKTLIKTDSRVIVEFFVDGEIQKIESEKIIDYTSITDSTKFYLVRYYNYYDLEVEYSIYDKYFITYNKIFSEVEKGTKIEPIEID